MKTSVVKNGLVVATILLFLGAGVIPSTGSIVEKTTIMDSKSDGYIQDLIDDANPGDTIYIPSGYYYDNIVIGKSINLIGEDKNTTIIDGKYDGGSVIYISADWVNISGFAIINGLPSYYELHGYGIYIKGDNNTIKDNNIFDNEHGIELIYSNNNIITGNKFLNNGLSIEYSHNNIISDNSFSNYGIYVSDSYQNNIVTNNTVNAKPLVYLEDKSDITIDNAGQVILVKCDNITIRNLEISHTYTGVKLLFTNNCSISHNTISNNGRGITLYKSNRNTIQKNNFWLNVFSANFESSWRNRWKRNYWNRPRLLPKLIIGFNDWPIIGDYWWFNIDWRPARLPYKIEVVI